MPKTRILQPNQPLTFSNYFEMNCDPEDILQELGFGLQRIYADFPRATVAERDLVQLKSTLERRLPYVSLTNETARREVLIAPVVLSLVDYTQARLRIEYPLYVSEQLKGTLDYYLQGQKALLIIEAKNADLARGFTQLAVELIALAKWLENQNKERLYGAVSTGDIWQLGYLCPSQQQITQDLQLYRVPADLIDLFRILVAVLGV